MAMAGWCGMGMARIGPSLVTFWMVYIRFVSGISRVQIIHSV